MVVVQQSSSVCQNPTRRIPIRCPTVSILSLIPFDSTDLGMATRWIQGVALQSNDCELVVSVPYRPVVLSCSLPQPGSRVEGEVTGSVKRSTGPSEPLAICYPVPWDVSSLCCHVLETGGTAEPKMGWMDVEETKEMVMWC